MQAERWRAKAVAKVAHMHARTKIALFPWIEQLQVMESQGRMPLQSGGGGGSWAFGEDDESGSLFQVM
jgi:hypothetical protein